MNKKQAIKSVSLLWMGSLLGSGSTFVIYIILARELGAESFGSLGSALSMTTILVILAGFGISQIWLKLFGQHGWSALDWIRPSLKFLVISILSVLIFLAFWAYFGPHDAQTRQILFILSLFIVGQVGVELISSKLQLEERYSRLALWQLLPNFLRLLVIAFLVYAVSAQINVIDIAWVYGLIGMFFALLAIYQLLQMQNGQFALVGHGEYAPDLTRVHKTVKNVFAETWPFGMASLFAFVYVQSDIVMVKYIAGDAEAGYYNVAFVVLTAIMVFPTVLYSKFFLPKYHRWANHDREKFYMAYKKGNLAMLLSGSVIMLILLFVSGWAIPFVFGAEYQSSILLINILAVTIPIYFVAYSVGATLITKNNMILKVKLMGATALFNIVLNLLLIPHYYAKGAAIATLISNILLLVLYLIAAQNKVFTSRKELHVEVH